jgi:3-hydroxyacyl-CoA dehydrogenase/enoyl-CoA hydratase/3-hydroxybutyryl-CoA epimerase
VVIEAIFENLEAKHALFAEARSRDEAGRRAGHQYLQPQARRLRTVLKNPARLVGIHFFNPVAKMPLVEVVSAKARSRNGQRRGRAFVKQIDRLPLPVKSAPASWSMPCSAPTCSKRCARLMKASRRKRSTKPCSPSACRWGRSNWSTWSASTSPWPPARRWPVRGRAAALSVERFNAGNLGKKTGKGFYDHTAARPAKGAVGNYPGGSGGASAQAAARQDAAAGR